jgi:hypothetical protein
VVLPLGRESTAPHEERRAERIGVVPLILEEDELEGFIEEINHLRRERERSVKKNARREEGKRLDKIRLLAIL